MNLSNLGIAMVVVGGISFFFCGLGALSTTYRTELKSFTIISIIGAVILCIGAMLIK